MKAVNKVARSLMILMVVIDRWNRRREDVERLDGPRSTCQSNRRPSAVQWSASTASLRRINSKLSGTSGRLQASAWRADGFGRLQP
jgi:hypothetical protein